MAVKAEKALQTAAEKMSDIFADLLRSLYRNFTPQDWAEIRRIAPAVTSKEEYAAWAHDGFHAHLGLDLDTGWEAWQGLKLLSCMSFTDLIRVADGLQGKLGRKGEIDRFKNAIAEELLGVKDMNKC